MHSVEIREDSWINHQNYIENCILWYSTYPHLQMYTEAISFIMAKLEMAKNITFQIWFFFCILNSFQSHFFYYDKYANLKSQIKVDKNSKRALF